MKATGTSARESARPGVGAAAIGSRAAGAGTVGILGGTFNPPHLGHLAVARHALDELALGRVVLMPAGQPPHKPGGEDPGPEHRLAMTRLVARGVPAVEVCTLELRRGGPSFTVDTLRELHDRDPDTQLTLILGSDIARTLPAWREPRELLALADLAVASREGAEQREVLGAIAPLLGEGSAPEQRVRFLSMPPVELSSSQVRASLSDGDDHSSLSELVGPAVAAYIAEHRLYRSSSAGGPLQPGASSAAGRS